MLMAHTYLMLSYWSHIRMKFVNVSWMITLICILQIKLGWLELIHVCFCRWWTYCKHTLTLGWWCRSRMSEQRKSSDNTIRCWSVSPWLYILSCGSSNVSLLLCWALCVQFVIDSTLHTLYRIVSGKCPCPFACSWKPGVYCCTEEMLASLHRPLSQSISGLNSFFHCQACCTNMLVQICQW